ncbi:MAG TPA: aconitase family protein [Nitrososphaerales archaeon]|nr:aconitase family protein [Nitrososphaerales archaeon]
MDAKEIAAVRRKMDTPKGTARVYSPRALEDFGYAISSLPYSVRILLENALRHSGRVSGAEEAALSLVEWPKSAGSELPLMPFRVLLQDYTGVPLVVDLAAMRDAAAVAGLNPRIVNSSVPVDLIIDHSIQVDAWSSESAFDTNLEREYERNSERYSLLKWAQTAFSGMRVFPPGKGICHQVNLEYLSTVVAMAESGGELNAFPDSVLGTDSHTTMVNGLGVLGWGVGGIEAEAVMLGEPYHVPIPEVLGVKLTGGLREGVTPTDMVLAVTEKLRERNVVGKFVEYFGDGYRQLTVPDRATLGNMSPEYGATVGFCPVDEGTLSYLTGTGRAKSHVEFVKRYAMETGLFLSEVEPRYSEVLTIDLDSVEPSIAGPRNPEERRPLRAVPALARVLYPARQGASAYGRPSGPIPSGSGAQLVLQRPIKAAEGLEDGAVVIAAITSCTNTSNPTVMVGAGLLAKKAVELGLAPKPWVKRSLAPGSVVVTDYLESSGLLPCLDRLGFNVVGYGCTTCIAEGTPVLLSNGTAKRIESLPSAGGASIFAPSGVRLGVAKQSLLMEKGLRDCVELVLQDGRTLVCTPDHKVLRSDGCWTRADELELSKDRVIVGLEAPLDIPGNDESGYTLRAGSLTLSMDTQLARAQTLAFARLLGHLLNDGSLSRHGQGRMNAGQFVDRRVMLDDIELITGLRPAANRYDERKWSIVLPSALTRAISRLQGVQAGKRILQKPTLPSFVLSQDCPTAVVREFLGGLFGADGHAPTLHRWGPKEEDSTLSPPAFSQSTLPAYVEQAKEVTGQIIHLLARCGVKVEDAQVHEYPTRRSGSSYPAALDGIPRVEVRLELPDGLSFIEKVGFRYCVDKAMRASAAAVYWRMIEGIQRQRLWMAVGLERIHSDDPGLSFPRARQLVATSLLGHETEESLPPVVAPHYALLEGHDRFDRLPKLSDRRFRPLHRRSCDFPSPVELFKELGVRDWFAPLQSRAETSRSKRYCVEKEASTLPTFSLRVEARRRAGRRFVYDLSVSEPHAFIAGTIAVHNCIGNSGPLAPEVEQAIKARDLYAVAVLSGNRNFDGRINPLAKGSFLMSPMLVVAYALAGRIDFDFQNAPLGVGKEGEPVYLKDIWPTMRETKRVVEKSLSPELYRKRYAEALKGDSRWEGLGANADERYRWEPSSTYVRRPPWFETEQAMSKSDIVGARVLAVLEDKVTTDHISPAGAIPLDSPAGKYLTSHGVEMIRFSSYGSRRGNHEVMVRGGFANIRLRNALAPGREGGWTTHLPSGEMVPIFDAATKYAETKTPLVIIAGKQYGAGSSRDWAAKAPKLLGVRAVIAESFERIHRSNLVAMGVLPLQFLEGQSRSSLELRGDESFDITGISSMVEPKETLDIVARSPSGEKRFRVLCRIDNSTEMHYVELGGVLPFVFSKVHSSVHQGNHFNGPKIAPD